MVKFMDEITEALTGAVRAYMEWVGEIAIYILGLLAIFGRIDSGFKERSREDAGNRD